MTDSWPSCVYIDEAVSSDRQYVGLSGALSAIVYCSLSSPAIYKQLIISIYDSRKQTLPVCHGALWILKCCSIQYLICQVEFWSGDEPINNHVYTLEQLHRDRFTTSEIVFQFLFSSTFVIRRFNYLSLSK